MLSTPSATGSRLETMHRLSRQPIFWSMLAVGLVVPLLWSQGGTLNATQEEFEPVGLPTVLSDEPSLELDPELFIELGGNWEDWSQQTIDLFYELRSTDEKNTIERQRWVLDSLAVKLKTIRSALANPAYRKIHQPLEVLEQRIALRLELYGLVLDLLTSAEPNLDAISLPKYVYPVSNAAKDARAFLTRVNHGSAWQKFLKLDELASLTPEAADGAGKLIQQTANRLNGNSDLSEAQQTFLSRSEFDDLRASLATLLQVLNVIDSGDGDEVLTEAVSDLLDAFERYESRNTKAAIRDLTSALDRVEMIAPGAGGSIAEFLRLNFKNYNVHFVATEGFLARIVNDVDQQNGVIRDRVSGASVYGRQTTNTQIAVDLKPGSGTAVANLTLNGQTRSSTTGVTSQARIYTAGNHHFWASKQVTFDGRTLMAQPARLSVDPNLRTVGAKTKYSWMPLIGKLADRYAFREAQRRRGQSEALTANKLKDRILPEFDGRVNDAVSSGNSTLGSTQAKLRQRALAPVAVRAQSTETALRYSSLIRSTTAADPELGANAPPEIVPPPQGLSVQLHESVMNNVLARFNLAGRRLTQAQVREELRKGLEGFLGRSMGTAPSNTAPTTRPTNGEPTDGDDEDGKIIVYNFDRLDPIRVRIDNGKLKLTLRAAIETYADERLREEDRKVRLSPRAITIEYTPSLEAGQILLEQTGEFVERISQENERLSAAKTKRVTALLVESLGTRSFDNNFTLPQDGKADILLRVVSLKANNGWLTLDMQ